MNIINQKVSDYIDTLYAPLSGELAELRAQAEKENIPVILRDTEMFLRSMIKIKNPGKILEIGTAVGYSAACFALSSENSRVASIEIDEKMYKRAVDNIEALGLSESVRVFHGEAGDVIEEALRYDVFDFVFIDAGKSRYKRFFDAALSVCAGSAIIISDNILLRGCTASNEFDPRRKHITNIRNMREYIEYILALEKAETSILPIGDGIALTVLNGSVN